MEIFFCFCSKFAHLIIEVVYRIAVAYCRNIAPLSLSLQKTNNKISERLPVTVASIVYRPTAYFDFIK